MIQALQAGDAYDNAQCYEVLLDLVEYESRSDHSPGDHLNHTGDPLRHLGLLVSLQNSSDGEDDQFFQRMAEQLDLTQADLVKLGGSPPCWHLDLEDFLGRAFLVKRSFPNRGSRCRKNRAGVFGLFGQDFP